jgi:hypothetical protein
MLTDWSKLDIDSFFEPKKKIFLGNFGERIAHHAFYYANTYFVTKLLKNKYDINIEDENGIIPIQYFFYSEMIDITFFQEIIELKKINFKHIDNYQRNCLHFLVMNTSFNENIIIYILKFFYKNYSDLFNQEDIYGKLPIDIFLTRKPERLQILKTMIKYTKNLDHLDIDNENLFQICITNNNLQYAKKYISKISVNNIDINNCNTLHKLCFSDFNLPLLEKIYSLIDKHIIHQNNIKRYNCYEEACISNKQNLAEYFYDKKIRSGSILPRQLRFCNLFFFELDRITFLIEKSFTKYNYKNRNILIDVIINTGDILKIKALNKYITKYMGNYLYLFDKKQLIEDTYWNVVINHLLKFY